MKKWVSILSLVVLLVSLSGCKKTSSESLEFNISTNDKIIVTLDNTDSNYHIKNNNGSVEVANGDDVVIVSSWQDLIDREVLGQMASIQGLEFVDNGSYSVAEDPETNQIAYIVEIEDTGFMLMMLGNDIEVSKDMFNRLKFDKK